MIKLFSVLLISLVLSSCAAICPQSKQAVPRDQQNFTLAFDTFQKTHRLGSLQKLKQDFPNSPWAARAETIILYAQELDQRKTELEKNRSTLETLEQENLELKQDNDKLTQQIEQLKGLLIQLENRAK